MDSEALKVYRGEKPSAGIKIFQGLLWIAGGIFLTFITRGQWLFFGAVIFGFVDIIMGLLQGMSEGF